MLLTNPDSQDICFVPNGDYSSVIKKFRPDSFKEGDIVDLNGKKLGKHEGIINYTVGQRKRHKNFRFRTIICCRHKHR